jgi:hypothetical protein
MVVRTALRAGVGSRVEPIPSSNRSCAWRESNPLPCGPEPHALSGELQARVPGQFTLAQAMDSIGRRTNRTAATRARSARAARAAGAVLALALAGLTAAGCQVGAPATSPGQVAVQAQDLGSDLKACPSAGSVDGYLQRLARRDPQGQATLAQGWSQLKKEGATDGAMAVYAARPSDCDRAPGTGAGRAASTLVARFGGDQDAAAAYARGAMGFPTPAADEREPGLRQGVATQLGERSWLLERDVGGHVLDVAYWQRGPFTVFFVGQDLDTVEVGRALVAVDGRAAR